MATNIDLPSGPANRFDKYSASAFSSLGAPIHVLFGSIVNTPTPASYFTGIGTSAGTAALSAPFAPQTIPATKTTAATKTRRISATPSSQLKPHSNQHRT